MLRKRSTENELGRFTNYWDKYKKFALKVYRMYCIRKKCFFKMYVDTYTVVVVCRYLDVNNLNLSSGQEHHTFSHTKLWPSAYKQILRSKFIAGRKMGAQCVKVSGEVTLWIILLSVITTLMGNRYNRLRDEFPFPLFSDANLMLLVI